MTIHINNISFAAHLSHTTSYLPSIQVFKLLLVPYKLQPHQKRPQDAFERTLYDFEQSKLPQTTSHGEPYAAHYHSTSDHVNLSYVDDSQRSEASLSSYKS
ncbi:hypothetical protein PoB_000901100 [Plakobranchus ocellatus]|uniref:Uncharacterized protein n=1 Tax=Plakobranchus ocellatus TaxID=259542 RepID=A0AAV3Y5J0_9GAST|nr:hypothetical protein PoB_000901100 [Plakobranchus ocellatus]